MARHPRWIAVSAALLTLTLIMAWPAIPPDIANADGVTDLLGFIQARDVNERALNDAACGVAAATMVLDYYLPQRDPNIGAVLDIHAVARYVLVTYHTNFGWGTDEDQLQAGIELASTDPALGFGRPLTARWDTTNGTSWFSTLKSELDAARPVIVYIPNGHSLGWDWNYPHFIVVSGYTSQGSIIYRDPWLGGVNVTSQ